MSSTAAAPPSIHVRAVITWLAIFPLVTLGFFAIEPFAADWNPVLRALLLSLVELSIGLIRGSLPPGLGNSWEGR